MTTGFYLVCGGSLAVLVVLGLVFAGFDDGYNFAPIFVAGLCFIGALGFALVLLVNPLQYRSDKINCYKFAQNSGRTVKFVKYSTWSWDCLTPTANGHWIPTSQLISVGKDNG